MAYGESLLLRKWWDKYQYTRCPDGTAPFEKVIAASKYGILAGVGVASYDSLLQDFTFLRAANCYAYWTLPFTGICATFAATVYTATKIRKKDDKLNYALGALATAPIYHAWTGKSNPVLTSAYVLFTVPIAMLLKSMIMSNQTLTSSPPYRGYGRWRHREPFGPDYREEMKEIRD